MNRSCFVCETDFVAETIETDISIPGMSSVPVMSVFGWIIFQQRADNTFDWELPWATYVAGFGSIDSNFWLGLENLYRLISADSYRLRIEVFHADTGDWYSAEYSTFTIADASDEYRPVNDLHQCVTVYDTVGCKIWR